MTVTREKGTLYIDAPLSNMAIAYQNLGFPLASGQAFPILPVPKQTGKYYTFNKGKFRKAESKWEPGSKAKKVTPYIASTSDYGCTRHKLTGGVTRDDYAMADSIVMARARTMEGVKDMLMLELEQEIATALTDYTTTYSDYTAAASSAWANDSSDPLADVQDALNSIRQNASVNPRQCTMVIGFDAFQKLQRNANVNDKYKHTRSDQITEELLARYFGVKKLVVSMDTYEADEGQSDSPSDVWDSSICTLLYAPDSPSKKTPSAGYIASEVLYDKKGDARVRTFEAENKTQEEDIVEVTKSWQVLETLASACYIITGC